MKYIYKISFGFLLILFTLTACKKYLEEKPDKQKIIPNSIEDLQSLLDFNNTMNLTCSSLGEVSSDNYYILDSYFNSISPASRNAYLWDTAIYSGFPNDWSNAYNPVYYSNIVLENIEIVVRTAQNKNEWDNIKGSAYLFRAKSFLSAVLNWSIAYDPNTASTDMGIPLRLNSDFNEVSARSSVQENYDRIIEDLKMSIDLLPIVPLHVMRPSKPAAYALLARTYLSMRAYDSCWKYADLSLQLKSDLIDYNPPSINAGANFPIARFSKEVILHSLIQNTSLNLGAANVMVDSNLYKSYNTNDLRKTVFFRSNGDGTYRFKGSYDGSTALFNGVTTDEVYLMRAEAAARRGDLNAAITDLNTLMRKRWKSSSFIPFTANTVQEALTVILAERRKELIFRDLRWMDLKRLNKEGASIVLIRFINNQGYTLPPNDKRYALPIPEDVINISGMPQNTR